MNKIFKLICCLLIIALPITITSCVSEDDVILKSDASIITATVQTEYSSGASPKDYPGTINQEEGTIFFEIPNSADITKLYIRLRLAVEATIEPGLRGPKNLSDPLEIVVKAGNGQKKIYKLQAKYAEQ